MYSESELSAAVAAGVIPESAAQALRDHVAHLRALPQADEEHFRLINSFNDIFVSIAAVILLVAMAWIGEAVHAALAGMFVAISAWGLAEFFTRQRRMALPSILLLLAFVGGVLATGIGFVDAEMRWLVDGNNQMSAIVSAAVAASAAIAAWFHWRRFMVPITVAAGAAGVAATVIALIAAATWREMPEQNVMLGLVLAAGLCIFAFAMYWDRSDTARQTRRSDVAFWLHLLAAPMIAHPLFALLGVTDGDSITAGAAIGVVALYLGFGVIALAIDRRALLVSALAYVLYAMTELFREFGAVEINTALTALVIGASLLLLSAFWQTARRLVLSALPNALSAHVPAPIYAGHSG
jgi:MFS family permease